MSNHDREGPPSPDQDAAMRRAWEQASSEEPPPELDASIIAAAHESVQDRGTAKKPARAEPRSRNWLMQWQPLAAAATVAGLAFILLQVMPRDRDVTPSIRMDESVPAATATPAAKKESAPSQVEHDASDESANTPSTVAPAQAPVAARDSAAAMRATETDQREAAAGQMSKSGAATSAREAPATTEARDAAAATSPAPDGHKLNAAPPSASAWAAQISTLYASGDMTGAADALRAFRAVDPQADTYLPESLRDWARTVE